MDQNFTRVDPTEISDNIFKLIGKDWMLITAANRDGRINTMTASWGAAGILWRKPVGICFIRPSRYTYAFAEDAERMSFSFFDESYRDALRYCGTHSGRDGDKFTATGLAPMLTEGAVPYIGEARMVMIVRKLYADDIKEDSFIDPAFMADYKDGDFHRFYICEIEEAWVRS